MPGQLLSYGIGSDALVDRLSKRMDTVNFKEEKHSLKEEKWEMKKCSSRTKERLRAKEEEVK